MPIGIPAYLTICAIHIFLYIVCDIVAAPSTRTLWFSNDDVLLFTVKTPGADGYISVCFSTFFGIYFGICLHFSMIVWCSFGLNAHMTAQLFGMCLYSKGINAACPLLWFLALYAIQIFCV